MKQFCKLGYDKTTIGDITKTAGLSTGTFYIYYNSKIEIFKTLLNIGLDGLRKDLLNSLKETARFKSTRVLRELALAYCNYYRRNPEYFQIIVMVTLQDTDLRERENRISRLIDKKAFRILRLVHACISEGIKNGEFRKVDPWISAHTFWATLDGVLTLQSRSNLQVTGVDPDLLVLKSVDLLILGIRK